MILAGNMKKVFIVNGLKRSGNHAIINWLRAHAKFEFHNNVIPVRPILNGAPLPSPFDSMGAFLESRMPCRPERMPFSWGRYIMFSLEDMDTTIRLFANLDDLKLCNILILRDPRNLFASRIRKAGIVNNPAYSTDKKSLQRVLDLWKIHAREFLGMTSRLEGKKVFIYYNTWFSSEAYRRKISQQLHLKFTDKGFNKVSNWGGGSSFDSTHFNGQSAGMNVLGRQQQLTDDEKIILLSVLEDEELLELSERIEQSVARYRSEVV